MIVKVDRVGDAAGYDGALTRMTTNPRELLIARSAADVIVNSGCFTKEVFCPCKPAPAAHRWR
ncbi:citrate lyase subunit alpha [Escherichia coli]